jgi:hypothetical protein
MGKYVTIIFLPYSFNQYSQKVRISVKRKGISILTALVAAILITTTVFAGSIRLSVSFSLGSLIAQGSASGLGNQDVKIVLEASGVPVVTCTNKGGNQAPGQNPPKVSASGVSVLFGFDEVRKNGKSPYGVETEDPQTVDPVVYGCPNANWTASVEFIHWTDAMIQVLDLYTGEVLLTQNYTCTTTLTSVSCKLVK